MLNTLIASLISAVVGAGLATVTVFGGVAALDPEPKNIQQNELPQYGDE